MTREPHANRWPLTGARSSAPSLEIMPVGTKRNMK